MGRKLRGIRFGAIMLSMAIFATSCGAQIFKSVPSVKGMSRVNIPGAMIKASGEEYAKYVSHLEVISIEDESSVADRKRSLDKISKIIESMNMTEMVSSSEDDEESYVYIEMGKGEKADRIQHVVILNIEGNRENPKEVNAVSITGDIPMSEFDNVMKSGMKMGD